MPPPSTFSDIPVAFDVNDGEQAQTRTLQDNVTSLSSLETTGFGVFAYYTHGVYPTPPADNRYYPNFMYNQYVHWISFATAENPNPDPPRGYWKYEPLKYWPNDYSEINGGAVDNQGATGSGVKDRVSFFAYAPYVEVNPATGLPTDGTKTKGIIGFKENDATGDPMVHYVLGGEDLVYDNRMDQYKGQAGGHEQAFSFKHALSAIIFNVGGYFDAQAAGQIDKDTYITIDEVKIKTTVAYDSWLNLRTGEWTIADVGTGEVHVKNEGINERIRYKKDASERYTDGTDDDEVNPGVGRNANGTIAAASSVITPLMQPVDGVDQYAMIVPVEATDPENMRTFEVTCSYWVWTFDPRNAVGITKVKNTITNSVTLSFKENGIEKGIEKGKVYAITMWLGMTSVKLEAKQDTSSNWPNNPEMWPSFPSSGGNVITFNTPN